MVFRLIRGFYYFRILNVNVNVNVNVIVNVNVNVNVNVIVNVIVNVNVNVIFMQIKELNSYNQEQFEALKHLMSELSERVVLTTSVLDDVLADANCHLYVVVDGEQIIGCATLCYFHSPTGAKASVEDVVVSSDYRGQHLGRRLVEHLIDEAKRYADAGNCSVELHLTSNPKRVVANKLYQALGFERKETNCYRMEIRNA